MRYTGGDPWDTGVGSIEYYLQNAFEGLVAGLHMIRIIARSDVAVVTAAI
jgi:hypothetical protein